MLNINSLMVTKTPTFPEKHELTVLDIFYFLVIQHYEKLSSIVALNYH